MYHHQHVWVDRSEHAGYQVWEMRWHDGTNAFGVHVKCISRVLACETCLPYKEAMHLLCV